MRTRLLKTCAALCMLLFVFGCGGGGGGGGTTPPDDGGTTPTPTASKLSVISDNYTLNLDTNDTATLTIVTRDASNAAVGGVPVTLSATAGLLGSSTVTTGTDGTATVKFYTYTEATSQSVTITAKTGSLTSLVGLTLTTTTPPTTPPSSVAKLDLISDSNLLNPGATATLTVYARNSDNSAASGVEVAIIAIGDKIQLGGLSAGSLITTNSSGRASFTLYALPNATNEVVTITATVSGQALSDITTVTVVAASNTATATKLDLTTNKTRININGTDSATLTIITRDNSNAAVGNVVVKLSSTAGFLSAAQVTTNATGTATATISPGPDKTPQDVTVTASTETLSTPLTITFVDNAGDPANMVLTSDLAPGTTLSKDESITITATVTDENSYNVENGTPVSFTIDNGAGSLSPASTTTNNGVATTTFTATTGGPVTVKGTSEGISDTFSFDVAPDVASSISFKGASPSSISIKSSGGNETSTLTFEVRDSDAALVTGALVDFAIATPLGGGEYLSVAQATTASGRCSVILNSGNVAGAVSITATINGTAISTTGKVIIVSGIVDSNHFSLAATKLNLPGQTRAGETSTITAYVADRYSNPVSTTVYFTSGFGSITGASLTNAEGQGTATHSTGFTEPPSDGIVEIVAWTPGQEAFEDTNGNGQYDSGEFFDDIGEPWINDVTGYRYVDINENGSYDGPNSTWDSSILVWKKMELLWTYAINSNILLSVDCPSFVIADGVSQECTIEATDTNGNPVIGGATITMNTFAGSPLTFVPTNFTVPDANSSGIDKTEFKFTVSNTPGGSAGSETHTITLNNGLPAFNKSISFIITAEAPAP